MQGHTKKKIENRNVIGGLHGHIMCPALAHVPTRAHMNFGHMRPNFYQPINSIYLGTCAQIAGLRTSLRG